MKKAIVAIVVVGGLVGGWFFFQPSPKPKVVGLSPHVDFTEVGVAEGKASMGTLSALEKEMARHGDGLKKTPALVVDPQLTFKVPSAERIPKK